jgi:hypothetical protein
MVPFLRPVDLLTLRKLGREPPSTRVVVTTILSWRLTMLKGGLLWLIGIPLPIILILWFMGFLS